MAIVFEMIPQAGGEGALLCQVPNTVAGDFDVVRPTIVSVEQNGVLTDVPVNVPSLEWGVDECPVLVTSADDKVTNAQVSFDASKGIFESTSAWIKSVNSRKITLSNKTNNNDIQIYYNTQDTNLLYVFIKSNNVGNTYSYLMDGSINNTYQLYWGGGLVGLKVNGITVFEYSFTGFENNLLTELNLSDSTATKVNFLEAKTKSILVHDSHDTKDKYLFKTFEEMASFAHYKIIQ